MSKQTEGIDTKQTAKARAFGSMDLKRSDKAEPRGKRDLSAMNAVEAAKEEKFLCDAIGEY